MKTPTLEERRALGTFLSSRRARLQPAEMGKHTRQRRTPGLRREEVAALAGVSVSWYTWLEQGRDIRVSAAALERIATVLRLDRAELEHLFALSSRQPFVAATNGEPSDALLELVQAVNPVPAYIRSERLDILAWNAAVAELFVDFSTLESHARNTLYLMFLYPPYRSLMRDWEYQARGTIRVFRAARAKSADKGQFDRLVSELSDASTEFRLWWQEVDVQGFDEGLKQLRHPSRGLLDLTFVALVPAGRPDLSFVTYLSRPGNDSASSQQNSAAADS